MNPATPNPSKSLSVARTIASFALLGAVVFGAFLSWLPVGFDIHVPGAILGAVVGLFAIKQKHCFPKP